MGVSGFLVNVLVLRKWLRGLKEAAAGPPLTLTFQLERDCCPPQALFKASEPQVYHQSLSICALRQVG